MITLQLAFIYCQNQRKRLSGDIKLKIIIWIIIGVIAFIGILMMLELRKFQRELKEVNPDYILTFIKDKAKNENVSLSINYNGDKWVGVNTNKKFPLASTVKIIVAIEYAMQVASGQIDSQKEVILKDLDKLHVPKTDGGAHQAWLNQLEKQSDLKHVPLREVVNGMIAYSSNANTDYLIDYLGIDNVNQIPQHLGISTHDPIFPVVGSLFISSQIKYERNLNKKELLEEMLRMDMAEYRKRAFAIHHRLLKQPLTSKEIRQLKKVFNMNIQKVWSDRLAGSTTADYISILEKINSNKYFSNNVHKHLDPIMEEPMKSTSEREGLVYAGKKGGSTAFVVNMAIYATDKDGNKAAFAFFSNELTHIERTKVNRNLHIFFFTFLKDMEFRERVKRELSSL